MLDIGEDAQMRYHDFVKERYNTSHLANESNAPLFRQHSQFLRTNAHASVVVHSPEKLVSDRHPIEQLSTVTEKMRDSSVRPH